MPLVFFVTKNILFLIKLLTILASALLELSYPLSAIWCLSNFCLEDAVSGKSHRNPGPQKGNVSGFNQTFHISINISGHSLEVFSEIKYHRYGNIGCGILLPLIE